MDPMKQMIQQKLIANVIMDMCSQCSHLIFQESLCSQEHVIRFKTPYWQSLLDDGAVMYEAENKPDLFVVNCVCKLDRKDPAMAKIRAVLNITEGNVLQSWDISSNDPNGIFDAFHALISKTIPTFEKELEIKLQADFVEGEQETVFTTKYERNPQARAACLAYHGYTCKLCGMNFEQVYGLMFKDIIEVHHIVPLNQIRKDYVVDPIHDLIPLCPNCHTAVHSKNGAALLETRYK